MKTVVKDLEQQRAIVHIIGLFVAIQLILWKETVAGTEEKSPSQNPFQKTDKSTNYKKGDNDKKDQFAAERGPICLVLDKNRNFSIVIFPNMLIGKTQHTTG